MSVGFLSYNYSIAGFVVCSAVQAHKRSPLTLAGMPCYRICYRYTDGSVTAVEGGEAASAEEAMKAHISTVMKGRKDAYNEETRKEYIDHEAHTTVSDVWAEAEDNSGDRCSIDDLAKAGKAL